MTQSCESKSLRWEQGEGQQIVLQAVPTASLQYKHRIYTPGKAIRER